MLAQRGGRCEERYWITSSVVANSVSGMRFEVDDQISRRRIEAYHGAGCLRSGRSFQFDRASARVVPQQTITPAPSGHREMVDVPGISVTR